MLLVGVLLGGYLTVSAIVGGGMFLLMSGFPGGPSLRETLGALAFGLMWPAVLASLLIDAVRQGRE